MLFIYNQENSILVEKCRGLVIQLFFRQCLVLGCESFHFFNYCVKKKKNVD
jgi:hypothetical protein